MNYNLNVKGSDITFGLGDSLSNTHYNTFKVNLYNKEGLYTKIQTKNFGLGINGKYYFTKWYIVYSTSSRSNKENMDIYKRKKMKIEVKAINEIDDLTVGHRDSRKKIMVILNLINIYYYILLFNI